MSGGTLKSDSAILSIVALTYYVSLIKTDELFSREIKNEGMQIIVPRALPPLNCPLQGNSASRVDNMIVQGFLILSGNVAATKYENIVALNMQKPFFQVNVKSEW
jgi:hypothetical protein